MGRLALSATYPLFVDLFGCNLRFCHLKFNKEAIFDYCRSESARYRRGGFEFLSNYRVLSFCGIVQLLKRSNCIII